jgi:hypothetical protein
LKINLRIEFNGGESKDVTCSASDLVKLESKFDISISSLETNPKFTHLCFLAWASEFRLKATDKEFDVWMDTVSSVGASDKDPK